MAFALTGRETHPPIRGWRHENNSEHSENAAINEHWNGFTKEASMFKYVRRSHFPSSEANLSFEFHFGESWNPDFLRVSLPEI